MLLREVAYAKPSSLAEALALLQADDGARALAGGQTLINVMKARAGSPDALIDLHRLEELQGIDLAADGTLTIGAMTTYSELVASSEARARPILGEETDNDTTGRPPAAAFEGGDSLGPIDFPETPLPPRRDDPAADEADLTSSIRRRR